MADASLPQRVRLMYFLITKVACLENLSDVHARVNANAKTRRRLQEHIQPLSE